MHRTNLLRLTTVLLLSAACAAANDNASSEIRPSKYHAVVDHPATNLGTAGASGSNGITYHGGPIMLGLIDVYYIWYGNWSVDPNAQPILQNLATSIGGSPYFAIN